MTGPSGFMEIDGIRLEYAWHGPAANEKPTILLLHEGLGSVSMWMDFPQALAEATGCGVLVYSRQGYGKSDPAALPRRLSLMEDEAAYVLPRIIDQWELKKVFLAGHSDGASIAAIYAGGTQDHRVRGLILMATHFFNEEICITACRNGKQDFEQGGLRQKLTRHHGDNVDCAFQSWNGLWLDPDFRDWNIEDHLAHIRVPMLLIWGAREQYASLAQVEAAREACTCPLEVVILEHASHWPFREQPHETLDAITAFTSHLMLIHGETVHA